MTREQLIACLAETTEHAWYAGGEDDGRYVDWTSRTTDGGFRLEAGDADGDAVQLELSRDDLVAIHRQLTLTLLADGEPDTP